MLTVLLGKTHRNEEQGRESIMGIMFQLQIHKNIPHHPLCLRLSLVGEKDMVLKVSRE